MEKGKLIYETPKDKKRTIIYFSHVFTGFCWFLAIIILYHAVKGVPSKYSFITYWMLTIFLVLILLFSPVLVLTVFLYPRFKIYEKGITMPLLPIYLLRNEGKFIPYSKIKGYRKYRRRNNVRCCQVWYECDKPYPFFIIYYDRREKVIEELERNLRQHKIPEMPDNCPNCNNKLYTYTEKCPNCGENIFKEK